jgi:hypothetical protein
MMRKVLALLVCAMAGVACSEESTQAESEKIVLGAQIDRVGRPLTNIVFVDALATANGQSHDEVLDGYNAESDPDNFVAPYAELIGGSVALLDAADGACGNGLGGDVTGDPATRYLPLAALMADDRLYLNKEERDCNGFFGIERVALGAGGELCGGRTPGEDVVTALYSAAVNGAESFAGDADLISDGLTRDVEPPPEQLPFLSEATE